MNFAAFSAAGGHFVTSGGQIPVTKIQQNIAGNGLQQVMVSGMDGVQYVRSIDGQLQAAPQLISVPIALPGAKPGDPQPTVQIQVLSPNMLQQPQPKYQMQIPIQGFQQGGAVLTVAYSQDAAEAGGIQFHTLPDGMQVLQMPQEMQLVQPAQIDNKDGQNIQHQVFITPNQQIVINNAEDMKHNNNNNMDVANIIIKEECEDHINDDESSQGGEASEMISWQSNSAGHADLLKYLNTLPPQQTQALPVSLQQFLRMNPEAKKIEPVDIEMSPADDTDDVDNKQDVLTEAVLGEDGSLRIQTKKKKKYRKKPAKPARPKPGQVVIAQASDGTSIFCCPECQMAYPEKEQLEMHLSVHNIERRFICGICGAGLKRKEHLERHKLGHNPERPYVCGVCRKGFKRREHLNLHAVIHSGVKTELCGECGKGFYRKDHLRKHTRSHETKRARDEASGVVTEDVKPTVASATISNNSILPEITIHVPTSANMQMPVQINIPQHLVSSLAAQAQQNTDDDARSLDALLLHTQHT